MQGHLSEAHSGASIYRRIICIKRRSTAPPLFRPRMNAHIAAPLGDLMLVCTWLSETLRLCSTSIEMD